MSVCVFASACFFACMYSIIAIAPVNLSDGISQTLIENSVTNGLDVNLGRNGKI